MRWSLSWHPEGRCDSFTKEAILACAPPISGVYGLFNFDCQLFIGESANIQDALLCHVSETDFKSRHLRATGFTFEPCAAELRKTKAAELIARFRPVLQTEAALTDTRSPSSGPMVSEVRLGAQELGTYADRHEFPLHEREKRPKVSERFHSKRTLGAAFAAMFVTTAVVIVYLGMATDDDSQKRVNGAGEKPLARNSITPPPAPKRAEIGLRLQNPSSIDTAGGLTNKSAEATLAKPDVHASALTPDGTVWFAAKSASAWDGAGVKALSEPAKTSPMAHSSGISNLSKKWSVQISAERAKDIADTLLQRLKAKSYDSYMVQAEVKGQTYYRVRVGHFDAREEAESVRQSLARQEGYRDAYLTGD
jgi:cell division septation protein DedD